MTDEQHSAASADEPALRVAEPPTNVRWLIFTLACGTSFLLYLHRYTWNFIGVFLIEDYGFSNKELGALASFFNASYSTSQIPSGLICDAIGAHKFLALAIVTWSLVLPLYAFGTRFPVLAAIRLVFGVAQAGTYPSLAKVTGSWFPIGSRTIAQGWIATFFGRGGGAMSSIIFSTLLIGYVGLSWQWSLVVMGGVGVLFGAAFLVLFRDSPDDDPRVNQAERDLIHEGSEPVDESAPKILPWRRVVRSRTLFAFVLQQITSAGADGFYLSFMGTYFVIARGVDLAEAGILASMPLFGGAFGGILGGYLNDWLVKRIGRRWARPCVGFVGKTVAAVLIFVVLTQESHLGAAMGLFFVKFFTDWSQPTVWGTCTDLGGGKYSATVFGIINTSGGIGGLLTPMLFGYLLDAFTVEHVVNNVVHSTTNYTPTFIAIAAMYFISAVCWLFVDSTKSLEHDLEPAA